MAAHITATPVPLGDRAREVPARLASLVMRCLEKDPARRPENAAELLRALDATAVSPASPGSATAKPSIAVLPFANLSPDPADEFFADGLTDEIITDLSGVKALHVIARTAMMRYKGADKEHGTVARELKVRYILDGSVRRAGESLRLTARLVDATDDTTVWSDKISGVVDDIFDMQERVSQRIVDALKVTLTPRESRRLASRQIEDLKAYEAYLQARQAIWTFDPAALAGALKWIDAARARIGENPRLLAAEALIHLGFIETGQDDAAPHIQIVARCADRLAVLEPDSYSRYAVEGQLFWRRGHVREAIASLSRALELEPSAGDACIYLAYAHLLAGQDGPAREAALRLVEIDPLTPLFQVMPGFCDIMAGRSDEGVALYRRYAEIEPANPIAQYFLLAAIAETDDRNSTLAAAEHLALRFAETVFGAIARIYVDVAHGRQAPADVVVSAEMRAHSARSDAFARPLAVLLARSGAADAAMDALEDSIRLGLAHYPYLARNSKAFAGVRDHPRFRRILDVVRERWERGGTSGADLAAASVPARKASVAILPFANLSPDPENEFFAEGITDDLIAQVAKIGSLRVIARTSVMRYRGVSDAARTASRELGVGAVVEGTVRRAGKRARIVAQLIDASSDTTVWSETYDRDLDDVFSVQTDVATRVAGALRATLTPTEERRLARAPTRDARAYDLYLIGRQLFSRRTPESLGAAIRHFEQAIERDSAFAGAYAGLADAYVFSGLGYAPIPVQEAFAKAKDAAARAVALDDASPDALCAVGISAMHGDWDVVRARQAFERALAISPSHAAAHQMLGWCTFAVGEYAAAVGPLRRARELDPLNVSLVVEEAWPYMYAELYDIGLDHFRRAVEIDPGFGLGHYNLGLALAGLGRHAEAMGPFNRAIECMGPAPWMLVGIATASIALGDRAKGDEVLATLEAQGRAGVAVWLSVAMVLDALGRADEAADALERAIGAHEPFVWAIGLEAWLRFPNARRLLRFQRILDRVGAKQHDVAGQRALLLAQITASEA